MQADTWGAMCWILKDALREMKTPYHRSLLPSDGQSICIPSSHEKCNFKFEKIKKNVILEIGF